MSRDMVDMYDLFVRCFVGFFFSSRIRHTRLSGDWSSDVCSSDLVEASPALVERAGHNARLNGLDARARFVAKDLFALTLADLVALGSADKWLVDPPREGAFALAKALADAQVSPRDEWAPPGRIVYVSCDPATLARDAGLLVHRAGYRCTAAGGVNMFPHTAHVESIACFDRC